MLVKEEGLIAAASSLDLHRLVTGEGLLRFPWEKTKKPYEQGSFLFFLQANLASIILR